MEASLQGHPARSTTYKRMYIYRFRGDTIGMGVRLYLVLHKLREGDAGG